jgi:ribosome-binding protein aMBF1 (putative translation factor)
MEGCVVPVSHGGKDSMIRCDVCGKPIYRAHTIITGSTLEAWCHTCFKEFKPEDSRIFDPENETWEISDGPSETAL